MAPKNSKNGRNEELDVENKSKALSIREIIGKLFNRFDHVASVCVDHPNVEDPGLVFITVYTSEAGGFGEQISLYDSEEVLATIENAEEERFTLPFEIIATWDGPTSEMMERTPVYMSENVLGAKPISVDDGIAHLQAKLGKPRDEVRELVRRRRN